jgi:type VI secretion system protein VasG
VVQICQQQPDASLEQINQALRPALLKQFPAAFLGRLTVVPYRPIADTELLRITGLKLDQLAARIQGHHAASLQWSPAVAEMIVARCHEVESGARNIDHIITQSVLPAIASEVLAKIAASERFNQVMLGTDEHGGFTVKLSHDAKHDGSVGGENDFRGRSGGGAGGTHHAEAAAEVGVVA